jgi:oligopeptide/dipeptide ABC transporter ATP-binding protein
MSAPQGQPDLLTVTNLTKRFVAKRTLLGRAAAEVRAVDGISFSLAAGETLALVGESGCGKSTVGRLVLDLIVPTSGDVVFQGRPVRDLQGVARQRLRADAQLIFQDPFGSLNPRMSVGDTLAEPLLLHTDMSAADRRARVADLMTTVGLKPQQASRYPHEFSGGQRQRIAIARGLAASPKLIVCDEPVSALDVSIRAQILNLLSDLQQKFGLAYIFISHDLSVVRHIADRVAVMYLGRIVETADVDTLFRSPRHPYTQALLSAVPRPVPGLKRQRVNLPGDPPSPLAPPSGCHLHPRCPLATELCRTTTPPLTAVAPSHRVACHHLDQTGIGPVVSSALGAPSASLERLLAAFHSTIPPQ